MQRGFDRTAGGADQAPFYSSRHSHSPWLYGDTLKRNTNETGHSVDSIPFKIDGKAECPDWLVVACSMRGHLAPSDAGDLIPLDVELVYL